MSEETDIRRFVATVKSMANDESDFPFVRERIKETTLYRLLSTRYDNIDDLLEKTLEKSTLFERMRELAESEWKYAVHSRVYRETDEKKAERIAYYVKLRTHLNPEIRDLYDRFMQRHSMQALLEIGIEMAKKYPSDGALMGKFAKEFDVMRPRR